MRSDSEIRCLNTFDHQGDRDDRRVGCDDGVRGGRADRREDLPLGLQVLDDGLNHEIHTGDRLCEVSVGGDVRFLPGAHRLGIDDGLLEDLRLSIRDHHGEPCACHDTRDATPHESGADDCDGLHRTRHLRQHAV